MEKGAKNMNSQILGNEVLVTQVLFFRPWILMSNIKEMDRSSNASFIRFRKMTFSDYWSDVVWSIEMLIFDYLEDVYIIFIKQMRYKN